MPHPLGRHGDLLKEFWSAVKQCHYVFEVTARENVKGILAVWRFKGFELGCEEARGRRHTNLLAALQSHGYRMSYGFDVPAVAESKDVGISWHDIQDELAVAKPTDRSIHVVLEAKLSKSRLKSIVVVPARDFNDDVDVERYSWSPTGRFADHQRDACAAHEDHSLR